MLPHLSNFIEDASDFCWANAKAAPAVLLFEMERGTVWWTDTECIDRIRRVNKQVNKIGFKPDSQKKLWYCKSYQTGMCFQTMDNAQEGRIHKHVCAFCIGQGRIIHHPEKNCAFSKRFTKNKQMASQ